MANSFLILIQLFNIGTSRLLPLDIANDVIFILSNLPINLQDCATTEVSESHIKYELYTPQHPNHSMLINRNKLNALDSQTKIVFIIHGWLQTSSIQWVHQMKDAYIKMDRINVIIFDWSFYARNNYASAVCAVPNIGKLIGILIYNLYHIKHVSLSNVLINGFSLGGHIAGYAGQTVKSLTGGKQIGQINGLDIAGPGYFDAPFDKRLDSSDAHFVQGIHTNNAVFGDHTLYGTVDFQISCNFLICASKQPGCPFIPEFLASYINETFLSNVFCSHHRSVAYFIESINSTSFMGFPQYGCNGFRSTNTGTVMGEHCPKTAKGVKYLSVNEEAPFAKGYGGTCHIL